MTSESVKILKEVIRATTPRKLVGYFSDMKRMLSDNGITSENKKTYTLYIMRMMYLHGAVDALTKALGNHDDLMQEYKKVFIQKY